MKNAKLLIVGADPNLSRQIQSCLLSRNFTDTNISHCSSEELWSDTLPLYSDIILVFIPESIEKKEQVRDRINCLFKGSSLVWLVPERQLQNISRFELDVEDYVITGSLFEYDLTRAMRYISDNQKQLTALAIDVDKKVQAEQQLERKNKQFDNVINSVSNGFFTINSNWQFTKVNKECERLTRHTQSELIGRCVWDLFPHVEHLRYRREYQRAMDEQVSVHFEEYDPEYDTWVSVNAYPTDEGLAVYLTDITAQKKMQELILSSEQNLLAIIDNTDDIIWSIDKKGEITTANQSFRNRISSITGKPYSPDLAADVGPHLFATWQQFFERAFAGESYKITWDEIREGRQIYEEISFNPIRNKNNEVIGISCFSRDITDTQLYLRKIEDQNERLKKIAWTQSHEVRKPLANILGLIELLQFHPSSHDRNQLVSHIETAAMELDGIVNKISAFTCSQTG